MRKVAFAFVLSVCAACTSAPRHPAYVPPPPDPRTQMAALEIRIYDLVQDERHRIDPNANALMLDSELVGAARKHSADMATRRYLAHASPEGETTASIIMDEDAQFQGLLGENIAMVHFAPKSGINVNAMARQFVDVWLNSPRHRENLSVAVYNRTGIGAAVSGDTVYVTQLFASDLGLPPAPPDSAADDHGQTPNAAANGGSGAGATPPAPPVPVPGRKPAR